MHIAKLLHAVNRLLQSYSRRCAFVAAQSPLESTRTDVWELIWQLKVKTVVLLCPLKENKKVDAYVEVILWCMLHLCTVCNHAQDKTAHHCKSILTSHCVL